MDEISVLDYLKFKLNPKNFGKEILPEENPAILPDGAEAAEDAGADHTAESRFFDRFSGRELVKVRLNPLFFVLSVIFALIAQIVLEPTVASRTPLTPWIGGGLYLLCAFCFLIAFLLRKKEEETPEKEFPEVVEAPEEPEFAASVRMEFLALSVACALLAFMLFGGNQFTFLNVTVWALSLIFAGLAFSSLDFRELPGKIRRGLQHAVESHGQIRLNFPAWNWVCLAVFCLCAFFLFHQLNEVPVDMVSDHAEKLYDIRDILNGESPIYFTRNTGRECFQFYFTVLVIKIFGTGLSFLSLKIGTALAGLFILPFVYKLGKMLGSRFVGLVAMLLCGISYWPIVIQRAGLRFAYYPMFTAPALYFLIRGLKDRSRGCLILSGIFLGIGLHGYSPFRIVPVVFVIFFLIWLLKDVRKESRGNALRAFLCLIFFAFLVFLPLARVTVDMPDLVISRSVSRLGESEKSFDASPLLIFVSNVWKGIVMPFWNDGSTWVHSIVYRPALDHLTGSFFFLGLLFVLMRVLEKRRWEDICMILAIPLLMLPSTLSLAFPIENPCLNRTAGALIPVMIIAAAGLCCTFDVLSRIMRRSVISFAVLCAGTVFILVNILSHNYDLIFRQYAYEYNRSAWNTTQIGEVIRGFADSVGKYSDAYVIPYPHWVDTRLVGINAGDPARDYSFDKSFVSILPDDGTPRLFIYRESDTEAADTVRMKFPNGIEQLHQGPYNGKNFYSYLAFGSAGAGSN